jgi:hypothetical protein
MAPSFDVAQFAKDSDARIARTAPAFPAEENDVELPRSETRLSARPPQHADESWAQTMAGTLEVVMPPDRLKRLPLDHRAGFLLSQMYGSIDLDTLVEVSAMKRDEVLSIVRDLFEAGVVEFR